MYRHAKGIELEKYQIRPENRGFKKAFVGLCAFSVFTLGGFPNLRSIEDNIQEKAIYVSQKAGYVAFGPDLTLDNYKGGWEPHTITKEDGVSPVWKISKGCTREKGFSSEIWRNLILAYNQERGISTDVVHLNDRIWIPKGCDYPAGK